MKKLQILCYKSIFTKENCLRLLKFGMRVATNIFQKLHRAFFGTLIFFYIIGGSKSKFCEFLHFRPYFQILMGHSWKKNQNIKKISIQYFKHIISNMYANFHLPKLILEGEDGFFLQKLCSKIAIFLQILTKIDNFRVVKKTRKIKMSKIAAYYV